MRENIKKKKKGCLLNLKPKTGLILPFGGLKENEGKV